MIDVQIDKCWVTWAPIGHGFTVIACFSPAHSTPIALVTMIVHGAGNAKKVRAEIHSSNVVEFARRQGVRMLINKTIFDDWNVDVIMTQNGTEDGEAFMKATGYRLDTKIGVWYLTKTMFKRYQKRKSQEALNG